jgi:hypothetical protein
MDRLLSWVVAYFEVGLAPSYMWRKTAAAEFLWHNLDFFGHDRIGNTIVISPGKTHSSLLLAL